jgi:hypothetical protein
MPDHSTGKRLLMKYMSILIFFCLSTDCFSQPELNPDTTIDYYKRFYENGKLKTTNSILYTDGDRHYYTKENIDDLILKYSFDTTGFSTVHNGLWIFYYDKKGNLSDSSNYTEYSLIEYDRGDIIGKAYSFKKGGTLDHFVVHYPLRNDTIFNGYKRTNFRKDGSLEFIEYSRFSDDSLRRFYYNTIWYHRNGTLQSYTLSDDLNYEHRVLKYKKNGFCYYELKVTKTESYLIKRKENRKKESIEKRVGDKYMRMFYKNGKLVREREVRRISKRYQKHLKSLNS